MRKSFWIIIVMALICLMAYADSRSAMPATVVWEYKVLPNRSVSDLNELGAEGWELIAVTSPDSQFGSGAAWFKRPKQ